MSRKGVLRPHQSRIALLQRLLDAGVIGGILLMTTLLPRVTETQEYNIAALVAMISFTFVAEINGLYNSWRGNSVRSEILRAWWCWLLVMVLLLTVGFATKTSVTYSRLAMTLWFTLTPISLSVVRMLVRAGLRLARDQGYNRRIGAIAGSGSLAQRIAETLDENPSFGIKNTGFYDDESDAKVSGDFDALVQ